MPYINNDNSRRWQLDVPIQELVKVLSETTNNQPGELNYAITNLILRLLPSKPRYRDLNSMIGVLSCCQQELYRRLGTYIEDNAIDTNGDLHYYTVNINRTDYA